MARTYRGRWHRCATGHKKRPTEGLAGQRYEVMFLISCRADALTNQINAVMLLPVRVTRRMGDDGELIN